MFNLKKPFNNIFFITFITIILLSIFSCKKIASNDLAQTMPDKKILLVSSGIGLKIRQDPSKESQLINILPYGTLVKVKEKTINKSTVDGINDYWYKMSYNNQDVWIFGGYLVEKLESNPIVGHWKSIYNEEQVWYFNFDNTILAGTDGSDHIFYKGTYELLGNKLLINNYETLFSETDEYKIINTNNVIEIEFINIDRMILNLENGIIFELSRDYNYTY